MKVARSAIGRCSELRRSPARPNESSSADRGGRSEAAGAAGRLQRGVRQLNRWAWGRTAPVVPCLEVEDLADEA